MVEEPRGISGMIPRDTRVTDTGRKNRNVPWYFVPGKQAPTAAGEMHL
jgi:hypothetical protein